MEQFGFAEHLGPSFESSQAQKQQTAHVANHRDSTQPYFLPPAKSLTEYNSTLPLAFPTASHSLPREKSMAVTWWRGVC